MVAKIGYKISIIYLFLFLMFIAISIKPMQTPIADGKCYHEIAANYKLFLKGEMSGLPSYLHRDRILPAPLAGVVAEIFNIPVSVAFRIVALLVVALFYYFSWLLLSCKVTNVVALTGLWLCYTINSYSLTSNLFNVYQLTDSMTYLWTILIAISFVYKKLFLFIPISLLAIITKQNLWFLVLPGYLFFLLHYFKVRDTKKLSLTLVFGLIVLGAILLMYFTEAGSIKRSMTYSLGKIFKLSTYKGRELHVLKELLWIYLPILPIIFIKYRKVYKKCLEYFPLVFFFAFNLIVALPLALIEPTMDFYTRIMQQATWPICAYVIVLIVNDLDRLKNRLFIWMLYIAPLLFGFTHLYFFTISFKPLFVFPSASRHLLVGVLIIAYFIKYRERKVKEIA